RLDDAIGTREGIAEQRCLVCAVAGEGARGGPEGAGERFLDDDVLAGFEGAKGDRLVGGRGRAHIDHVDVGQQRVEVRVRRGAAPGGERLTPLYRGRRHADDPRLDPIHATVREEMEPGGEARADDADPERGHQASLWYGADLRGDISTLR